MSNPISWFEVPVTDMKRAIAFYNTVFGWNIEAQALGDEMMAWFPFDELAQGASGSLVKHKSYVPNDNGVLVYFVCDDVDVEMSRVAEAGGQVLQPKKMISPDHGYMGLLLDTEGNRIALHSKT